ncbi:MAG: glycosyltransferase [Chitinophagales bacterium]|nr:glycosyltransferase [Chitinophagales bacterium]
MKSNENKHIIFTVSNDISFDQRMHKICSTLSSQYKVTLIGRLLPNSMPIDKRNYETKRIKLWFNNGFLFYAVLNIALFFKLLFIKADIFCACDADTLLAVLLAGKIRNKKNVFDAHEYFSESTEIVNKPFVKSVWQKLEQFAIPKVDAAYTVCDSLANIFTKKYNKKFEVIRNVPFENKNKTSINEKNKYLLYQGNLNIGRGLEEMLLAMMYINNIPLYIIGDGIMRPKLEAIIQKYQLQDKVFLLGRKTPKEIIAYTQNAFVGINLLENRGLSYYYSLSNKFFDYIQAQVPQIAIAFPEYIHYNEQYNIAVMVDNLEIHTIVDALNKLIQDEDKYIQLKLNCIEAAQALNWNKESIQLINIYNNLF